MVGACDKRGNDDASAASSCATGHGEYACAPGTRRSSTLMHEVNKLNTARQCDVDAKCNPSNDFEIVCVGRKILLADMHTEFRPGYDVCFTTSLT